ncbi:MAG: nucleotide exchange factor GrpE [Bacteroidota bacterium]|nr:nucleotide exchange factor GrpE [Bacteroidota bacterium]
MMHYKSGKTENKTKGNVDDITSENKGEVVEPEENKTPGAATDDKQQNTSHEESVNPAEEVEASASGESNEEETPGSDISAGAEKSEDLQLKINDLNDRYLRLYSEFDNYRKRTLKERIEMSKTASAEIIQALLPVVDDFDRAIKSWNSTEVEDAHLEGIKLISSKLHNILKQQGLEEISAVGLPLNTDFHEAITQIPAPSHKLKDKIVDVVEKGYTLNGKVIRFAKVVVGS